MKFEMKEKDSLNITVVKAVFCVIESHQQQI
jgi:hypothetical protein